MSESRQSILLVLLQATVTEWMITLSLIFGGCCSNAWALELATSQSPRAGSLITFAQFLLVSLYGLQKHLVLAPPPATPPPPPPPPPRPSTKEELQRLCAPAAAKVLALHAGRRSAENVCVAVEGAGPAPPRVFADALAREIGRRAPGVTVVRATGPGEAEGLLRRRWGTGVVVVVDADEGCPMPGRWDCVVLLGNATRGGYGSVPEDSVLRVEYPATWEARRLGFLEMVGGMRLKRRSIPISRWGVQVALFFLTSVLNNAAFGYDVPMPVHIIFRSGGLVVNMVMGTVIDGRRYNVTQVISVVLVTLGVICTTLSASQPSAKQVSSILAGSYFTGILILTLALVMSGFMGPAQDRTYAKYGRGHWQEAMFYLHFLALPGFAFVWRDLVTQLRAVNASARVEIGLMNAGLCLSIPSFYLALLLNIVTQLLCVSGVHRLTSRVNSLTVTLVLVVRKAVSLGISVGRGGGGMFWIGAGLVLAGTIGYTAGSSDKVKKIRKES